MEDKFKKDLLKMILTTNIVGSIPDTEKSLYLSYTGDITEDLIDATVNILNLSYQDSILDVVTSNDVESAEKSISNYMEGIVVNLSLQNFIITEGDLVEYSAFLKKHGLDKSVEQLQAIKEAILTDSPLSPARSDVKETYKVKYYPINDAAALMLGDEYGVKFSYDDEVEAGIVEDFYEPLRQFIFRQEVDFPYSHLVTGSRINKTY